MYLCSQQNYTILVPTVEVRIGRRFLSVSNDLQDILSEFVRLVCAAVLHYALFLPISPIQFARLSEVINDGKIYQIVGPMGACLDKLLCSVPKRKCEIYGRSVLGIRLNNGTYTGILGELQSGSADYYLKGGYF